MCGIAGILNDDPAHRPEVTIRAMAAAMARRGPDHEGFWSDPSGRVHLGFRRLAIIDLSPAGQQPMVASDGRSVIVFNGELYNFQELRRELEANGTRFYSRSDTEVVLESLVRWGADALPRFNGMFALAWYELAERRLLIARDHAGIKPLYYATPRSGVFAFASQLDALLELPALDPDALQLDAVRLFLRLHHLPAPFSVVRDTYQLEPGQWLQVGANGRSEKRCWWRLPRSTSTKLRGQTAVDALDSAVANAVKRQLVADVPVGVLLSGGVDSPLVASYARDHHAGPLKSFTIGNPGWRQDESADAGRYAEALGLDHHLHSVSGQEALATLPEVIAAQHEPFGDYSMIPTLLVSRIARREVTVALSGDGGDELFFGYERPLALLSDGRAFRWPRVVRQALYGAGKYGLMRKWSSVIVSSDPGDYYFNVNCRVSEDEVSELAPELPPLPRGFEVYAFERYRGDRDLADYSRYVEYYGQLQRGLKKVDLASMHQSLEVRVPLLDREVIDVSLQIDPFDAMRGGGRKQVLVDLLARRVPRALIPTTKRGFAVPLGEWLRTSWRDSVEETLFGNQSSIFDRNRLRRYWYDQVDARADHKWGLWTILALEWWRARVKATRLKTSAARATG